MRSLLIPAGVIACGLLAALPFRRSVERPTAPPIKAAGVPHTVTPLREAPLAADWPSAAIDRSLTSTRFASVSLPAVNPYKPPIGSLSTRYHEVAVPLALPEDPSNLLATAVQQPAELHRYGIPASPSAANSGGPTAGATAPQIASAGSAEAAWRPESAIPEMETQSALASVLESQPAAQPEAQRAGPPQPANLSAGPFQTVSKTRVTMRESDAEPSATRERMFIREPQ